MGAPPEAGRLSRWEHFPHDADIGVRGFGHTLAEAFEQAGLALTAVITDLAAVAAREPVTIECRAEDPEALLYDWLNALVYEMATRRMLFGRFEVSIENGSLRAIAWGEPVRAHEHQPAVEVKAATYSGLAVARGEDGLWRAECVVDV
jgi:SHS2 domain-containing protein